MIDAFPDEGVFRDSLASITRNRELARQMGDISDETLMNAFQFTVIFNYDLRVLQVDVQGAGDSWRGRLYTRYLMLVMHEAADDLVAILGTHFRAVLKAWHAPEPMIAELNALHKQLTAFRRDNEAAFAVTRNSITAHRDHDATLQLQALEGIDIKAMLAESYRLLDWMTSFHKYCSRMLDWQRAQLKSRRIRS
jgi:hypothetical protein